MGERVVAIALRKDSVDGVAYISGLRMAVHDGPCVSDMAANFAEPLAPTCTQEYEGLRDLYGRRRECCGREPHDVTHTARAVYDALMDGPCVLRLPDATTFAALNKFLQRTLGVAGVTSVAAKLRRIEMADPPVAADDAFFKRPAESVGITRDSVAAGIFLSVVIVWCSVTAVTLAGSLFVRPDVLWMEQQMTAEISINRFLDKIALLSGTFSWLHWDVFAPERQHEYAIATLRIERPDLDLTADALPPTAAIPRSVWATVRWGCVWPAWYARQLASYVEAECAQIDGVEAYLGGRTGFPRRNALDGAADLFDALHEGILKFRQELRAARYGDADAGAGVTRAEPTAAPAQQEPVAVATKVASTDWTATFLWALCAAMLVFMSAVGAPALARTVYTMTRK